MAVIVGFVVGWRIPKTKPPTTFGARRAEAWKSWDLRGLVAWRHSETRHGVACYPRRATQRLLADERLGEAEGLVLLGVELLVGGELADALGAGEDGTLTGEVGRHLEGTIEAHGLHPF